MRVPVVAQSGAVALKRRMLFPRSDETAEEMLARTFIAPLSTGVAAIDRCAALLPPRGSARRC